MSSKPGDRQLLDNAEHKMHLGSTPNGVANKFLAIARGCSVTVHAGGRVLQGTLLSFDAYSIALAVPGPKKGAYTHVLVFKGPGVAIEVAADAEPE